MKTFYITTPIYYVNDSPHIGHIYTTLATDIMARTMRIAGYNTHFLTGTDEHGKKIQRSAQKVGMQEQEFVDNVAQRFIDVAEFMNFSHDDFIRTSQTRHKKIVEEYWNRLYENGWIYKDKYSGWYCVSDEAFYDESELIDGKAPSGKEVEWQEEESYFFRLSEFQKILLKIYKDVPEFVRPAGKLNEVIAFVSGVSLQDFENGKIKHGAIHDLSVSRTSIEWGIQVPNDNKHVIYVWLDALLNYISAIRDKDLYDTHWQSQKIQWIDNDMARNSNYVFQIVGKDILRFHAVYWPAFLIAANYSRDEINSISENIDMQSSEKDQNLINKCFNGVLPRGIFAHGWWTNDGQKISKSLGNAIDPIKEVEWIESFGIVHNKAVDYFRYFLVREMTFGNDGDYSRDRLVNTINNELANNFGNLVQRVLSMVKKDCAGLIPDNTNIDSDGMELYECDAVLEYMNGRIVSEIHNMPINKILELAIFLSADANKYIEKKAPWIIKKEKGVTSSDFQSVLWVLLETIRKIAIVLQPFVPTIAGEVLDQLGCSESERTTGHLNSDVYKLKSGVKLFSDDGSTTFQQPFVVVYKIVIE